MKKIILFLLTLGCFAQAQAQLVHSARDVIVAALTKAKDMVVAHPYLSVAITSAVAIGYWVYKNRQDEDEDVSSEAFKQYWKDKSASPSDSPTHSTETFRDFTGEFPSTQSKKFHESKLRHN